MTMAAENFGKTKYCGRRALSLESGSLAQTQIIIGGKQMASMVSAYLVGSTCNHKIKINVLIFPQTIEVIG
jgi:hypothetical protein